MTPRCAHLLKHFSLSKSMIMNYRNYHQPPIFDVNNLDEDHEIRIKYDRRGNPTRIRKVRRWEGCTIWLFLFAVAALAALAWHIYGK